MLKILKIKSLGDVAVRPMLLFDVPEVYKVESKCYIEPWSEKLFYDCVAVGYHCWVLEYNNQLIGYAIYRIAVKEAHLFNIAVDPQYQNKGIARQFLSFILDHMQNNTAKKVILEVRVSNAPARKLYEDFNFKEVGMRKDYYPAAGGGREDAVNYELVFKNIIKSI